MRPFSSIFDPSFRTSPTGERLFNPYGPWARPFIIPDQAAELSIRRKLVWEYSILFGLIMCSPFLFKLHDHAIFHSSILLLSYFILVGTLAWALDQIVMRRELKNLRRVDKRMPLRLFYRQVAESQSLLFMTFGFLGSFAFVALGLWEMYQWTMDQETSIATPIACILVFGLCACGYGYIIFLKLRQKH
jgi:hypothetical protein